jgi:hypothetical protein
MERLFKFLLISTIVAVLASCEIFYAPINGRWNIDDPKNELLAFNPVIDGYVHSVDPLWVGSGNLLAYPGSKFILLRFDTNGFPDSVAVSYLQLTVQEKPYSNAELLIYRIISNSEPGTFTYNVLYEPGRFYDDSRVAKFTLPKSVQAGEQIQFPVTEAFSGDKDGLANGIMIYSPVNIGFYSTETGTAPLLLVGPE